jgi:glycosyltransferase involved in cell wall biosynthesis
MAGKVLHLLSQRPSLTGSGITLEAFVREAADRGWEQRVSVGVPQADTNPTVGGLPQDRIHPLRFESPPVDFPVPGMSDVMPYRSTVFSQMIPAQIDTYRQTWVDHIGPLVDAFQPDLIHSHHVWLMSALVKDIAPNIPVVTQCHATGLRQAALCAHLADGVIAGCRRNERFVVLHEQHAAQLAEHLAIPAERIDVVGAGYRADLFHAAGRRENAGPALLYAGKYSLAKGLPWLLDAVEVLRGRFPDLVLHVAGMGSGPEADALSKRMDGMGGAVQKHGQVDQQRLSDLMRQSALFVLPSFYEGIPLVLVEALACGSRLVCTDLPGVQTALAPHLGPVLRRVPLPRLDGPDTPVAEDLPAFVVHLTQAIEASLAEPPLGDPLTTMPDVLAPFTWKAVFDRVERVWSALTDAK